jgi:transposase-like protein
MNEVNPTKKKRIRRSPEKVASLVLEAERVGAAVVCRREAIAPSQLSRWKEKFLTGGVSALREMKRGPRGPDPEKVRSEAEVERLKAALVETNIELMLLKKSVSSGSSDR